MNDSTSVNDRHQSLRAATAQAHARVNRWFPQGFTSLSDYRAYLLGLHRVCCDLAPVLDEARTACEALKLDLGHFGMDPLVADVSAPELGDDAACLGGRYVLLGSSLGARQLVRHATALGADPGQGGSFLHGHAGDGTAQRWRDLLQTLRERATDESDTRMHAAAVATFAAVDAAFSRARQRIDAESS